MAEAKESKGSNNQPGGRYNIVLLAREWVQVLQRREEYRETGPSELVKKALEDIQSGSVTPEEILKARAKMKTPAEEGAKEGAASDEGKASKEEAKNEKPKK